MGKFQSQHEEELQSGDQVQIPVLPLSSSVTLYKSFNLSLERDRDCEINSLVAKFCHGIQNSRRQVPKEQGSGI